MVWAYVKVQSDMSETNKTSSRAYRGVGPRRFYGTRESRLNVLFVLPSREGTEPLVEARFEVWRWRMSLGSSSLDLAADSSPGVAPPKLRGGI